MGKLRVIKRTFKYFDKKSFTTWYKTYVCGPPSLRILRSSLVSVSKKRHHYVRESSEESNQTHPWHKTSGLPGEIQKMGLNSLEQRRVQGDLIETYKILNGMERIDKSGMFTISLHVRSRGHSFKLYKPALKKGKNFRKNFFSYQVISTWNSLPASVVMAKDTNQFKDNLDSFWKENGYGVVKAYA